jgi:hypothetical protein
MAAYLGYTMASRTNSVPVEDRSVTMSNAAPKGESIAIKYNKIKSTLIKISSSESIKRIQKARDAIDGHGSDRIFNKQGPDQQNDPNIANQIGIIEKHLSVHVRKN